MKQIKLTKGYQAIVDDKDYESILSFSLRWYAVIGKSKIPYAACTKNKKIFLMHRVLIDAKKGVVVDHIDGNSLNNSRENLRTCTHSENVRNRKAIGKNNSSGYKGVIYEARAKMWRARIQINKKSINIGYFLIKEEAARAYDKAAKQLFGEFAKLNF